MNVALYARVSTKDKGQDTETQLYLLREEAKRRGWQVVGEWVDTVSAKDMRGRTSWRELMVLVRAGQTNGIAVTKLDRCFRSVSDTYDGLNFLQRHKVDFIAVTQPIDTTTAAGKLLLGVLAAVSEFERDLLIERVKEGMIRARSEGKHVGRPKGSKDKKKRRRTGYLLRHASSKLKKKYGQNTDSDPYG